jgi:hypothetical protein
MNAPIVDNALGTSFKCSAICDLLISVLFRQQHGARRVHAGGRVDLLSVLRFIPIGVFDDATVCTIGRAFDAACKELKDTGQPDVVHEVMIKRIIAAARRGERDVKRLRDAGLTGPAIESSVQAVPTGGATSTNRV